MAAHVVVEDLSRPTLEPLGREDAHHLDSVLRLRPGEAVSATDGRGGYLRCTYAGRGAIEPAGEPVSTPAPSPRLTIGFVPVKGDRPDWAVQKLAELGVDRIVVVRSERSVVRWDGGRAGSHLDRLRRVARSAVMQSRQVWLPEIAGVLAVGDLLGPPAGAGAGAVGTGAVGTGAVGAGAVGAGAGRAGHADGPVVVAALAGAALAGAALADMGGRPSWAGLHTVLVGPEGGWSEAERSLAGDAVVGLGPSVLRAETAAVTAGALLCALRAGMVAPAP